MTGNSNTTNGAEILDPAEQQNHDSASPAALDLQVVERPAGLPTPDVQPQSSPPAELKVLPAPKGQNETLPLVDFVEPFAAFLDADGSRTAGTIEGMLKCLRIIQRAWFDFSTVPLKDLRKSNMLGLNSSLNRAIAELTEAKYANDTKNNCSSAVRQLLAYICDGLELITDDKFERLTKRLKFYQSNVRTVELPTNQQIEIMRQYLRKSYEGRGRYWAQIIYMFEIYRMFSPRRGTLAKLKVWDLDFKNSRIRLTINKQRKGAKARTVNLLMPESVRQPLQEYVTCFNLKAGDTLFTVSDIRGSLKSAAAAAGLSNWYHHAFRKLTTIRMIEANVPVPVIAAILGHRDNGATILKNYWHYCEAAMDAAMQKYDGWCNGLPSSSPADVIRLKAALLDVLERICAAPTQMVAPIVEFLMRVDEHLRAGRYGEAVAELPKTPEVGPPAVATPEVPHISYAVREHEGHTVANNLLYLMLANGRGIHEFAKQLGFSANALYKLRRGQGLSPAKLREIEEKFGVPDGYLNDPTQPRADFPLIRKNLQFIAEKLGLRHLPRADTLSEVLDGKELPCGDVLRRLTEELPFLTIAKLMTVDLAKDASAAQAIEDFARTAKDRKINIAAHIQMHYRLANCNGMQLARTAGLKSHQIHAYASGRQLAPKENASKIAAALSLTLDELYRPAFQPDAKAIGQRLGTWISEKKLTTWTAAQKMQTSPREFAQVVEGKRAPSARQLRKISKFFGKSLEEILGMPSGSGGHQEHNDHATAIVARQDSEIMPAQGNSTLVKGGDQA